MIGQSQVTEPLMTALRTNRVNHAYLFSGPRGCGKTTSARILARCLNCAEGPTDTPCGVCPSCVELSRDGGGSLDVVEIDAASHNGVDDARDIRERAIFAPARDRYKIFILDEAHMVTPQGFNALLKIVEEPPEHVKFIFATTEPEKVIGTIRSRTHHYPFRLVPPAQMLEYVQHLCESENMRVAPGVLPLVVRAGGGSPRDTLSLLDQLMAGSDSDAIEYERAVALLGYTHGALLDEAVDAIAARDSSAAFDAVDRVIQTGQDPRRFVEDLLERLRDLIIVAATSAEGASAVLRGVPQDEIDRMAVQASKFGPAELSRTADILNSALTEMTGATSPRLHLELMIARALIPASDDSTRGALARVERLERRVGVDGRVAGVTDAVGEADAASAVPAPAAAPAASAGAAAPARAGATAASSAGAPTSGVGNAPAPATGTAPGRTAPADVSSGVTQPADRVAESGTAAAAAVGQVPTTSRQTSAADAAPVTLQQLKDAWPEVLDAVKVAKLSAWLVVLTARVLELRDDNVLLMSFPSKADVDSFKQKQAPGQGISDYLRAAIIDVLGIQVKFLAREDSGPAAPPEQQPAVRISSAAPTSGARHASATGAQVAASTAQSASNAPGSTAGSTPTAASKRVQPGEDGGSTSKAASARTNSKAASGSANAPAGSTSAPPTVPATGGAVTGWATVAIPGAQPVAAQAPTQVSAATTVSAAAEAPTPSAANAANAASAVAVAEPPFNEEPPPFDDDVPPDLDAPETESQGWADAAPVDPFVSDEPAITPAPSAAPAAAPVIKASPAARSGARPPAFEEKQRYGESVVREILGATFLEEQPHVPAPRSRGE